jgi:hypothetical protein
MQSKNNPIAVVQRLYRARGNPEIIREVLAPDVRWEVVPGFPHSDVYLGLDGVFDFFTRLWLRLYGKIGHPHFNLRLVISKK